MRTKLYKMTLAAGFTLAMVLTFTSCGTDADDVKDKYLSSSGTGQPQVDCPDGLTWDGETCSVEAVNCPDNTVFNETTGRCSWIPPSSSSGDVVGESSSSEDPTGDSSSSEVVGESSSSVVTGESSSSVGGKEIIVGAWTFKAAGDEGSKSNYLSDISISESAGAITGTGTIRKGTTPEVDNWGFAQINAWPNTDAEMAKFKAANSISFTAKGDGKTYFVELALSSVEDGAQYRKTFTASSAGSTVTACFNEFAQADWGTKVDFDKSKLTGINLQAHSDYITGNFNLSVSNVSVGVSENCNGDGTITVGAWTFKAEGDEGSKSNYLSDISISESAGAITGTGTVRKGTASGEDYGFAQIVSWPNTDAELAKYRAANSVSFTAKGDAKTYYVELAMSGMGNAHYRKTFTTSPTGNAVTVCFKDLAQPNWVEVPVPFDASKLVGVNLQANSDYITGNFSFSISNVSVGVNASCNGSTTTGTLVKPWWWWGFSDADNDGGTSSVELCGIGGQIPDYENMTNGVTFFKGNVARIPGKDYGFAGCAFSDGNWEEDGNMVINNVLDAFRTLTPTSTISFNAKGNGTYKMILKTSDVKVPGEEHVAKFTATTAGQAVNLKLSDFEQPDWATEKNIPLNMSNIEEVQIQAHTENILGDFSLEVRDITVK